MTYEDLLNHYQGMTLRQIAKEIGLKGHSPLDFYRQHGIPIGRQAIIEVRTKGALKADVKQSN